MFWLWDYVNDMRKNRTFEMTGNCQYPAHLENKIFMNLQQKHFNCGKNKNNNSIKWLFTKIIAIFLKNFYCLFEIFKFKQKLNPIFISISLHKQFSGRKRKVMDYF
jgi:hypothetical protein